MEINVVSGGFVSRAASARWAIHACEAAMFNDRTINQDLLQESHLRPLWNLYPDSSLNTQDGRTTFLEKFNDKLVEKDRDYWESIVAMSGFLALLSTATVLTLRRQDTL